MEKRSRCFVAVFLVSRLMFRTMDHTFLFLDYNTQRACGSEDDTDKIIFYT